MVVEVVGVMVLEVVGVMVEVVLVGVVVGECVITLHLEERQLRHTPHNTQNFSTTSDILFCFC